jgi:hypothetical protein
MKIKTKIITIYSICYEDKKVGIAIAKIKESKQQNQTKELAMKKLNRPKRSIKTASAMSSGSNCANVCW